MNTLYEELESKIPSGAFVYNDIDADIDIAVPKYWKIIASSAGVLNLVAKVTCLTAALLELYKAPTITGAGTALTAQLLDQNASLTPDTVATYDPTNSDDGTLVFTKQIPAAYAGEALPKLRLEKGVTYQIKITSIADNNKGNLKLVCFEDLE